MSPAASCVAIDFETSGRAPFSACAVGMARIEGGKVGDVFYSLIRPPSPYVQFTEIHGLTWDMLKEAPGFGQLYPAMKDFLQGAEMLLAHNAIFDQRVLQACCQRFQKPPIRLPFLCTLRGARALLPLPSKRLAAVCQYFDIPLTHHHAASDAVACAQIYLRLRSLGASHASMALPEKKF